MAVNPLLRVNEVERSIRAYETFGFSPVMSLSHRGRPYFVELRHAEETGNGVVMLLDRTWWRQGGEGGGATEGFVLYVPVRDVAAWWARLRDKPSVIEALRPHYYGREFVLEDPDGFRLAFFQAHPAGECLAEGVEKWTAPR